MKGFYKILLCFFLFTFFFSLLSAQHKTDSLLTVIKTGQDDTNKVKALKTVSDILRKKGKYDSSMAYASQAKLLAEKLGYEKGIAGAQTIIGVIYRIQGNYSQALEADFAALAINEKLKDKNAIAVSLGNIGLVYWNRENYTSALNYDFRALEIYNSLKDKNGIARNLGNIGIIYYEQHNFPQALEYFFNALKMERQLGDSLGVAATLGNIGNVYTDQGNYPKALEYDNKALELSRNLGNINGFARNISNIGSIYLCMKNYKKAKECLDTALVFSNRTGEKSELKNIFGAYLQLDTAMGNFVSGLRDYQKFITYRDSLANEASTKKIVQAEMNFVFQHKQDSVKAIEMKKDALAAAESKRQKVITLSVVGGMILVLVFSGFVVRSLRITRKQKQVIEVKSKEVEEKNKDILDSITYAKRLQDAILPPLNVFKTHLPDSFLLYKPKDIVAGDFYWLERLPLPEGEGGGEVVLVAACDCTGHGVPGAMVSVVCSNALNRALNEFKIRDTGKILDKVRELVLETFAKSSGEVKDGMDCSFCAINTATKEIEWSGAYNPLWYVVNGEVKEITGDKQPIGKADNPKPFTTHSLSLSQSTLYLFTDGYADQFGGPKGKKFKYAQLKDKLSVICSQPMEEQKKILEETLENWKGSLEQVDDILIIGIRV